MISCRRILLVGSNLHADGFEWHIMDALKHMGCEARFEASGVAPRNAPRIVQRALDKLGTLALREPERLFESRLVRGAQNFQPDLILVALGSVVSPKTIAKLRALIKAPVVAWCQDQMTTLGRQYLLGAEYDAVFVKDRHLHQLFTRMVGPRFHYLPEACNPRVHRSLPAGADELKRYGCEVMIAGTLYYYRQEILKQLAEFDLKVWGSLPDWLDYRLPVKHPNKDLVLDHKARAMGAAKICLNTMHLGEVNGLNCRAFEIAGCGGFQLISHVEVLSEHFEADREVVSFRSTAQLKELIRHYLDRPEEAAAIAKRGQARAHRDHTYEQRLTSIFEWAGSHRPNVPRLSPR